MTSIDSLTFDLAGCTPWEQSASHREWTNSAGTADRLQFHAGPPNWPFDLTMPDAATEFYGRQCAGMGGAMLSMEVTTAAGAEALTGLFKYRAPAPRSLAMYYVAILWLPFRDCNFQINVEAMERGTTGTREAAVMAAEGDKWPKLRTDAPPIVLNSMEELFERLASSPIRRLPSDEPKYDSAFPDHPLSRVRRRLADILATARIGANPKTLKPFRIRRGWRLWW